MQKSVTFDEDALELITAEKVVMATRGLGPMAAVPGIGSFVRERTTGYQGVVTGITQWMPDGVSVIVQSKTLHNGNPVDALSIFPESLEVLEHNDEHAKKRGGTRPDASPVVR